MQLGIISGWDEAGFQHTHQLGLKAAEFCINTGNDTKAVLARADEINGFQDKYGVRAVSVGRWGSDRLCADGSINEAEFQSDKDLIDLCAALGTKHFICGCNPVDLPYIENMLAAAKYFNALIAYAQDKGVDVNVYNCDWNNIVYDKRAWDIVLPLCPGLGIKYDASHCINRDDDYLEELLDYGQYVRHVHLKGTVRRNGKKCDDPPAGMDDIAWGAIFAILYDKKYDGAVSIEPHSGTWSGALGDFGIRFTIGYMQKFLVPEDYISGNAYMP